jgi:hypothetical protein
MISKEDGDRGRAMGNAISKQKAHPPALNPRGAQAIAGLNFPVMPKVRKSGAYDPADLLPFISNCRAKGIRPDQIALKLKVPQHRIVYFMGDGRKVLKRRVDDQLQS